MKGPKTKAPYHNQAIGIRDARGADNIPQRSTKTRQRPVVKPKGK